MSEVAKHRVMLSHKRLMAASFAARNRPQMPFWLLLAGFVVALTSAIWVSGPLSFLLVQQLPFSWMFAFGAFVPTLVMAVLGLLAIGLVAWGFNQANRKKLLRHFERLGIPLEIEGTYEILPDGLSLATERIEIVPTWAAVDTVSRVHDGWVISADQLTFFLPSDSFTDGAAERAFLSTLVEHLTKQARARSPEACRFSGQD